MIDPTTLRTLTRDAILSCTRCSLAPPACTRPVPFRGRFDVDLAVIGEAPGSIEDKEGAPFVGPSGQLLERMMQQAEIDPDRAMFLNTVSCKSSGPPSPDHVAACSTNRLLQLSLARRSGAQWLLIVGSVALKALLPEYKATWLEQRALLLRDLDMVAVQCVHPAAALRDGRLTARIASQLQFLAGMMGRDEVGGLREDCVVCGEVGEGEFDENGAWWCLRHLAKIRQQTFQFA